MKNKLWLILLLSFTSGELFACPSCLGTNPNDKYYLWVIGAFILLLHIPMYFMFKMFIKLKDINNKIEE